MVIGCFELRGWSSRSYNYSIVIARPSGILVVRSSQAEAVLTRTWCASLPPGCPLLRPFPQASYLFALMCVSWRAADTNHAWRGHLMWKARVNKIPAGRKMHNHCPRTGASHHEIHAKLSRLNSSSSVNHSLMVKNWLDECAWSRCNVR